MPCTAPCTVARPHRIKGTLSAPRALPDGRFIHTFIFEPDPQAMLIGRIWCPEHQGPVLVRAFGDTLFDLCDIAAMAKELLELDDPARAM